MLKSFSAKNFRTLDGGIVDFEPLTFLVGPNASGKSNILRGIQAFGRAVTNLADHARNTSEARKRFESEHWKADGSLAMHFAARLGTLGSDFADYEIEIGSRDDGAVIRAERMKFNERASVDRDQLEENPKPPIEIGEEPERSREEDLAEDLKRMLKPSAIQAFPQQVAGFAIGEQEKRWRPLLDQFRSVSSQRTYMLDPRILIEASEPRTHDLEENGRNFPSYLEELKEGRSPDLFDRIRDEFRKIFPFVSTITVPTVAGRKDILFWENGKKYAADKGGFSGGMLLALAYLAVAMEPDGPSLLCIEEPENGLHPKLLGFLVDFFRGITEGRFGGKRIQIVLTTHSPILLDFARPQEVRIVRRTNDGKTRVKSMTAVKGWERLYKAYDQVLGELWFSGALDALSEKE
jgi:predicted ATPase